MKNNQGSISIGSDFRDLTKIYTKNWIWFLLSIILALTIAFLYVRYSIPKYSAESKIQILDEENTASELAVFQDLDIFSNQSSKVKDELEILKSRSNFINVVKDLNLNIKITSIGSIVNTEVYDKYPFKINFLAPQDSIYFSSFEFYITIYDETTYGYSIEEEEDKKTYAFGKNKTSPIGEFVVTPDFEFLKGYIGRTFKVSLLPIPLIASSFQSKTIISSLDEGSNIVKISLNSSIPKKSIDIINKLVEIYNANGVEDKRIVAERTRNFINKRIDVLSLELSDADQNAQDFKTGRGLTNIESQSSVNINIGASSEKALQDAEIQLNIASSMRDVVDTQNQYEVLPSNVGLNDASIANTTARYNQLVLERKKLLESSNDKNPVIVNLNQELNSLKRSMVSSLNGVTNNLNLQVNSLSSQLSKINSKIYSAPKNERALRDITRQQQTTESLYLYLLQKREESQIAFASAAPKSKIIDRAYNASPYPVSPQKKVIFLVAAFLGTIIPFSIIYLIDFLDNKIHSKLDLENLVNNISILGEIPKLAKKENKLVSSLDRSVLGESLRILRTNLDYLLKKTDNQKGKVILVTSSLPGEGKTFLSSNLSMIYASAKKKVLLLGADIRNPKLYDFYDDLKEDKNSKRRLDINGLTDYLLDENLDLKDIVKTLSVKDSDLDVIYSGKIPPNPAELLLSERVEILFKELRKNYDYIIVDSAPLVLVTDTVLIGNHSDHIVYLTKAGFTEQKILQHPISLLNEGKLKNLSFVVNNVKATNLGYGGKYGYGYGDATNKKWSFLPWK